MSSVQLLDTAGRRRSPATLSEFHGGRAPGNKGQRCAADPPAVAQIIAVMRHAAHARYGNRLNGLIVVLWRAGLRINEALSLTEPDLEEQRGSVLVRHDKNDRPRQVGMDAWSASAARIQLHQLAVDAGIRRRFAPHQLRHAHAVELLREGIPLPLIQRQLGHSHLSTTGTIRRSASLD
jgi:site-specific recombinase XerD